LKDDPHILKWRKIGEIVSLCRREHTNCNCGAIAATDGFIGAAAIGDMSLVRALECFATRKGWALYKAVRHDHDEVAEFIAASKLPLLRNYETVADNRTFIEHGKMVRRGNISLAETPMFIISEAFRNGDVEAICDVGLLTRYVGDRLEKIAVINNRLELVKWIENNLCATHHLYPAISFAMSSEITDWWVSLKQFSCKCGRCCRMYESRLIYINPQVHNYDQMKWYESIEILLYTDSPAPKGFIDLTIDQKFAMALLAMKNSRLDILLWLHRRGLLVKLMALKRIAGRKNNSAWGFLRDLQTGKIK
jgi:hypothetical protein